MNEAISAQPHPLKLRNRISVRLYLAISGAVALTMLASLVGWILLNRIGVAQNQVTSESIPQVVSAFRLAQISRSLVAAAPRLIAAESREDLSRVSSEIHADRDAFALELNVMGLRATDALMIGGLTTRTESMILNLEEIESSVERRLELALQRTRLREEFSEVQDALDRILTHAVDDQLFYMATGFRDLSDSATTHEAHFSERELQRFRFLSELIEGATLSTQLLESAFTVSEIGLIEPLVERFEATEISIERGLEGLGESASSNELAELFGKVFEMGTGEGAGFNIRFQELALTTRQRELVARNRDLAAELGAQVEHMVDTAYGATLATTNATSAAILTGTNILIGINILSIIGAALIGALIIGALLRRLGVLSDRMLRMADGELSEAVEISGRDEVAEMAMALEVFRQHALEVQRLNLVEKLAQELREKNDELERVLEDLRKAQDQIIIGQKLAELGELTAGVAHEIRNPLNFVKNFSEVSEELVEELFEELESVLGEEGGKLDEAQRDLIADIRADVADNLKRIQSHSARADRIVNDMLLMSRGEGHWQATDVNLLTEEHARLAYHSLRATNPEFNLDLQFEMDSQIGERMVIPQDLGRVFLNMVSNACHATEEKRRALAESGDEAFHPQLRVSSHLMEDDSLEVRIRDNGFGIEPEVMEKMFNPFFTTKPPNQGTGLGLAISSDIVREHGGSIQVASEVGEFTEMTVRIPREPATTPQSDALTRAG